MPALDDPKLEAFAREYVRDFNGSRAARDIGFTEKSAGRQAGRMMALPEVQARIAELVEERSRAADIDSRFVFQEWARIARGGLKRFFRPSADGTDLFIALGDVDPDDLDLLQEITQDSYTEGKGEDTRVIKRVKIKAYSRLDALTSLARALNMFKDAEEDERGVSALRLLLTEISGKGSAHPIVGQRRIATAAKTTQTDTPT